MKFLVIKTSNTDKEQIIEDTLNVSPSQVSQVIKDEVSSLRAVEIVDIDKKNIDDYSNNENFNLIPIHSVPISLVKPLKNGSGSTTEYNSMDLWGLDAVGSRSNRDFDGKGVVVAILDSGIDINHKSFQHIKHKIKQKDFTGEGDGDPNGHGTHCAGTIFGKDIGIAPNIDKVLVAKVLDEYGSGNVESMYEAMIWAFTEGAHIISMSIGIDFPGLVVKLKSGRSIEQATNIALSHYRKTIEGFDSISNLSSVLGKHDGNTIIIAASGNESDPVRDGGSRINSSPPSSASGVISVGAFDSNFDIASFSNTEVDLVAPGVGILSAESGGNFIKLDGTSMAAPHVAGVAALWAQKLIEEKGNIAGLENIIIGQANLDLLNYSSFEECGQGLIKAPKQ